MLTLKESLGDITYVENILLLFSFSKEKQRQYTFIQVFKQQNHRYFQTCDSMQPYIALHVYLQLETAQRPEWTLLHNHDTLVTVYYHSWCAFKKFKHRHI